MTRAKQEDEPKASVGKVVETHPFYPDYPEMVIRIIQKWIHLKLLK